MRRKLCCSTHTAVPQVSVSYLPRSPRLHTGSLGRREPLSKALDHRQRKGFTLATWAHLPRGPRDQPRQCKGFMLATVSPGLSGYGGSGQLTTPAQGLYACDNRKNAGQDFAEHPTTPAQGFFTLATPTAKHLAFSPRNARRNHETPARVGPRPGHGRLRWLATFAAR